MEQRRDDFYYEGFSRHIGTVVPDDVFDVLAPRLKESELRVLLYIVRHTFGWRKYSDAISLSQLTNGIRTREGQIVDLGTGMSRKAVIAGVKGLVEKGIITVHKGRSERGDQLVNIYQIRFRRGSEAAATESNQGSYPKTLTPVTESNHRGEATTPPPVTKSNPQQTSLQQTDLQDTQQQQANDVVAISSAADKHLYEELRALGIHQQTAVSVLSDYPRTQVREMLQYLIYRLQGGWRPKESPAAWLIAALRDDYTIPQYEQAKSPDKSTVSPAQLAAASARRTADIERRLDMERRQLLEEYSIEQDVEDMWQSVRERLRKRNEGSLILAASLLRISGPGKAELLVPRPMLKSIKLQADVIRAAVEAEAGCSMRLSIKALR